MGTRATGASVLWMLPCTLTCVAQAAGLRSSEWCQSPQTGRTHFDHLYWDAPARWRAAMTVWIPRATTLVIGLQLNPACAWRHAGASNARSVATPNLLPLPSSVSQSRSTASALASIQPFSQKSHTPTVAKEFQIGLYDPTEADLEHFWNCCSEGFLGERL